MERISYYDLSANQSLSSLSGKEVDPSDLSKQKKLENCELFDSNEFIDDISSYNFEPLANKNTSRWEKAVATMIYAISDQIPNREEIKRGRQIIERLPKSIKKDIDRQFVIGFLPYLLIGFNFHLKEGFISDSNFIKDGASFTTEIYKKQSVSTWSFLCSHRESRKVKTFSLRDHIHEQKALRSLNLELGLLSNAGIKNQTVEWYQQTPTLKASSNIFPEIFINYLKTGRIIDLMKTLKLHKEEMERLMKKNSLDNVCLELKPLDNFTSLLETFLEERYGRKWMYLKPILKETDLLLKVTNQMTIPELERLMLFCDSSENKIEELNKYRQLNLYKTGNKNEKDTVNEVLDWFMNSQKMTKFSKALYETAFYFLWGFLSAKKEKIAIGLDRDHGSYQYYAYKHGFKEGLPEKPKSFSGSFIYARRVDNEKPKGILSCISFRQFWRDVN